MRSGLPGLFIPILCVSQLDPTVCVLRNVSPVLVYCSWLCQIVFFFDFEPPFFTVPPAMSAACWMCIVNELFGGVIHHRLCLWLRRVSSMIDVTACDCSTLVELIISTFFGRVILVLPRFIVAVWASGSHNPRTGSVSRRRRYLYLSSMLIKTTFDTALMNWTDPGASTNPPNRFRLGDHEVTYTLCMTLCFLQSKTIIHVVNGSEVLSVRDFLHGYLS